MIWHIQIITFIHNRFCVHFIVLIINPKSWLFDKCGNFIHPQSMKYTSQFVRQKFLDFMAEKGHSILPSASLVPKEDPTVLFNTAGMQPLVPYLMGQKHPQGTRLANSQKCLRTDDVEEVGDNRHLTYFEMLGSWSLGDYFKSESIQWGFEFLTGEKWLNLNPQRLFVTVYKGHDSVEADEEAIETWKNQFAKLGMQANVGTEYDFKNPHNNSPESQFIYRISKRSGKDNWWGLPYKGPCGPCSEIYYLLDRQPVDFEESIFPKMSVSEVDDFIENEIVEIWNHVFMQFIGEKDENKEPKNLTPMASKNIDTGMGLERLLAVINGYESVYETDMLKPLVEVAHKYSRPKVL